MRFPRPKTGLTPALSPYKSSDAPRVFQNCAYPLPFVPSKKISINWNAFLICEKVTDLLSKSSMQNAFTVQKDSEFAIFKLFSKASILASSSAVLSIFLCPHAVDTIRNQHKAASPGSHPLELPGHLSGGAS
tara:strand:+ start:676 stop:1071 length:396 start_codon:yes stop_codon:yes gene_type:complete